MRPKKTTNTPREYRPTICHLQLHAAKGRIAERQAKHLKCIVNFARAVDMALSALESGGVPMGSMTSMSMLNLQKRPVVSPAQCRGARALLRWTQDRLAERAAVARKTVADFELGNRSLHRRTRLDITIALEAAGIEFIW